ncbi:SAM-dependent methyltransferase, partial [Xenorhabdus bovienii]|uniref:SAM-dependent methyltransferase n=1 Tax=Xenorhabdus bovienii TaxID=40576 RepID=UPI0023B278A3
MDFDTEKVWFVGAGPGDKSLITLKGYQLLQQAQLVIYAGSLINRELLEYCRADAECHDSAGMTLAEITDSMVKGVNAGKLVIRLQTGDLSLFGSIREQAEELAKRGIGFVSVP